MQKEAEVQEVEEEEELKFYNFLQEFHYFYLVMAHLE